MWELKYSFNHKAQKEFDSIPKNIRDNVASKLEQLRSNPNAPNNNIKALTGNWEGYLRYRVGDYRVIYKLDEVNQVIEIISIAHRSSVYE